MMKKRFSIILLVFFAMRLDADDLGNITGIVLEWGKTPAKYTVMEISIDSGDSKYQSSNENGEFSFQEVPYKKVTIKIVDRKYYAVIPESFSKSISAPQTDAGMFIVIPRAPTKDQARIAGQTMQDLTPDQIRKISEAVSNLEVKYSVKASYTEGLNFALKSYPEEMDIPTALKPYTQIPAEQAALIENKLLLAASAPPESNAIKNMNIPSALPKELTGDLLKTLPSSDRYNLQVAILEADNAPIDLFINDPKVIPDSEIKNRIFEERLQAAPVEDFKDLNSLP